MVRHFGINRLCHGIDKQLLSITKCIGMHPTFHAQFGLLVVQKISTRTLHKGVNWVRIKKPTTLVPWFCLQGVRRE